MADTDWRGAPSHLRSVRDLVRFGVSAFGRAGLSFGHGSDNAFDEAVYLVLSSLKLPLDRIEPFWDAHLTRAEVATVLDVLERRCRGTPAAYLTGEAWLGPYRFTVDERVIVPRSLIAESLLEGLEPWIPDPDRVRRILDLCTGSGCLAILAAHAFPAASVDAVDISPDALAVAEINVTEHGLSERVRLIASDLYAELAGQRYDLIISNPPYVNDESMAHLPAEYRAEPDLALRGGPDGLDLVDRILAGAPAALSARPEGILVVEIGHEREHFERRYPRLSPTWLSTSAGDDSVFMVSRSDLADRS